MEQDFFSSGTEQTVPVGQDPSVMAPVGHENHERKHPIACFFHLAFKIAAIVTYLLLSFFVDSFVLNFIVVLILLAADFWTVKNVTGRLLMGLRWWHYVKEDGTNVWMFESSKNPANPIEAVIFWTALVGMLPVWVLLGVVALLKFNVQWLFLIGIALVLSGANIIGYGKCLKNKKQRIKNLATSVAADYVVNNTFS